MPKRKKQKKKLKKVVKKIVKKSKKNKTKKNKHAALKEKAVGKKTFKPVVWAKKNKKKMLFIISSILVLVVLLFLLNSKKHNEKRTKNLEKDMVIEERIQNPPENSNQEKEKDDEMDVIDYEIVITKEHQRDDGGSEYYVLIGTLKLDQEGSREKIKNLVKRIVKEKGNKITIVIYDDKDALESSLKPESQLTMEILLNKNELEKFKQRAKHLIAKYEGEKNSDSQNNVLYFFPSGDNYTEETDNFMETVEFNASQE